MELREKLIKALDEQDLDEAQILEHQCLISIFNI
jgi:hypothetical protein